MKCPYCGKNNDKVVDSRSWNQGKAIKRRRLCLSCRRRFVTLEEIEDKKQYVIKSDDRREPFNREKLQKGIQIACNKRPISIQEIEDIVTGIEDHFDSEFVKEIESRKIGMLVSKNLKKLDEVAYVRFASVYKKFKDKDEFIKELTKLN